MALSPYTFSGALALLDPDQRTKTALEKVFGAAIFAGAGAAAIVGGPVVGLGAAAWLALVDPKNDAANLLAPSVSALLQRRRGTTGKDQLKLIAAAHTITVLSSFFDTLPTVLGKAYGELALTDREKNRLTGVNDSSLFEIEVPLVSPELGLNENIERNLTPYFERLARRCIDFFTGLEAWSRVKRLEIDPAQAIVHGALERYRGRMLELGTSAPFALWLMLNEFAATRAEVAEQAAALGGLRTVLSMAMGSSSTDRNSYRAKLALAAQEVLDEPLLRSRPANIASPTVRDGFVEPAFQHAVADSQSRPADEGWWRQQPEGSSLIEFLAGYLASPEGAELPLLMLGHPGAGKSLLTEVLAAQLPPESFAVIRVPLRSVNPDDDLTMQITKELQRALQRPNADLDELRQECGPCTACEQAGTPCPHRCHLVVLLDGFDELVQATGVAQSAYLTKVASFQKRARTLGTPTSIIVTSRTVVADRAEIPASTPMIKLLEFDKERIERWLTVWNAAHTGIAGFVPLEVEEMTADDDDMVTADDVTQLTRQPLLLLMLAVYLAELGTNKLVGTDLTQSELYQRILDRFISRQITEKTAPDRPEAEQTVLQAQQRRQLQYAAIGMFNRGRQHIADVELNADLAALEPPRDGLAGIQPLTAADRVLGEFMFVHNPRADYEQRSAYEFLHATFGEFLVAELVVQQLTRLMRHRALEAADPALQPTGLDDSLLRRLLSHQPLSTREPVLRFITELSFPLAEQRAELLATISELLRHELTRPDTGDPLYRPLPYDPVRRRACYTANLTMIRVVLDPEPVPVKALLGEDPEDRWIRIVRLWRAGLDDPSWKSVMQNLSADTSEDPPPVSEIRLTRFFGEGPDLNEAELLGDRSLKAARLIGARGISTSSDPWRRADLAAIGQISTIHFASTRIPHPGGLLPFDYMWYEKLHQLLLDEPTVNGNVMDAALMLLSQSAGILPADYVREMLEIVLPASAGREFELATIAASHPALFDALPELEVRIGDATRDIVPTLVSILWCAERQASGLDQTRFRDLRIALDREVTDHMPFRCNNEYFAPEFVTYLRLERPQHWADQPQVPVLFEELESRIVASIAPEDALYVATEWPDTAESFIEQYLSGREIDRQPDDDPLRVLQELAGS